MDIQGLHYCNPTSWKKVIDPLKAACARALVTVASPCLSDGIACEIEPKEWVPVIFDALKNRNGGLVHSAMLELQLGAPRAQDAGSEVHSAQFRERGKRLNYVFVDRQKLVSVHELATNLLCALDQHFNKDDVQLGKPPPYLYSMAIRLSKVTKPYDTAQLQTVAFEVFAGLRFELDLQAMRVEHGMGESVHWLDRKLRLTDTVQNACLRFLQAWESHPELAGLVVGEKLSLKVPSITIRRALKEHSLNVDCLMKWDEHYVRIQLGLAQMAGAPLSSEQRAKLKTPLSSKRADTYRFERTFIQEQLKTLKTLREQGPVILSMAASGQSSASDFLDVLNQVKKKVSQDDADTQIQLPPPAEGFFDPIELSEEEGTESNPSEGELGADSSNDTEESGAGEEGGGDGTEGPNEDQIPDDSAADGSPVESPVPVPKKHLRKVPVPPSSSMHPVTEVCLGDAQMTVRVGVLLFLSEEIKDRVLRKNHLLELEQQYIAEDVFQQLNVKPRLKSITDEVLAAHTEIDPPGRSATVGEYINLRDETIVSFRDCARRCLKQLRGDDK